MPKFFVDKENITDSRVFISGEDARHIAASLRMTVGEELAVSDKLGTDYFCKILTASANEVVLDIVKTAPSSSEPPYTVRLYQCIPKSDKFDSIIQKAVECGVGEIIPVESSRCVALIKSDSVEKKLARWNKIAYEAAKQSGRGRLVKVREPLKFDKALLEMSGAEVSFICYENEDGATVNTALPKASEMPCDISFLIGPEGGLSAEEVKSAAEKGVISVGLGKRILRTETASSFVLAIISSKYEL